jgi:hypothetical protein
VRGIANLEALRDLGKRVYALDLARDQAGVFWYEYGKSRNRFMAGLRKSLGGSARHLLKRIRNANGDLAALGAMLYRIQQGAVKLSDPQRNTNGSSSGRPIMISRQLSGLETILREMCFRRIRPGLPSGSLP